MYIQPINNINNVNFGLKVSYSPSLLRGATNEECTAVRELVQSLRGNRMEAVVHFGEVFDSQGKIVNVSHIEGDMSLPSMYKKNQPYVISDFINFLRQQIDSYERRFMIEREAEDAFGPWFLK